MRYHKLINRKKLHKIEDIINKTDDIEKLREVSSELLKDVWTLRKEYYRLFKMIDEGF